MQKIAKTVIVIVDGCYSGRFLVHAFNGHGYSCIHVSTTSKSYLDSYEHLYIDQFMVTDGDISMVLEKLRRYKIKSVISGCEFGVNTADAIAQHFNIAKNDVSSTLNRRNKFYMIEALTNANVSNMQQISSSDLDAFLSWYAASGLTKVVLKPLMAFQSDGVSLCSNRLEIIDAYKRHHNKVNIAGYVNTEFVMQEFLEGNEYMINSVSCDGTHFITDIWLGCGGIKDKISTDKYAELIHRQTDVFRKLEQYIFKTLDALNIKNGAAHSEAKLTNKGPMLIECGARLTGGQDFAALEECQGYSQLSLTIDAILYPNLFKTKIAYYANLTQKYMRFVYLCSEIEGEILIDPDLSVFLELESLESIVFFQKVGDYLYKTNDVVGRPGYAFLVSNALEKLESDYLKVKILEAKMYKQILQTENQA